MGSRDVVGRLRELEMLIFVGQYAAVSKRDADVLRDAADMLEDAQPQQIRTTQGLDNLPAGVVVNSAFRTVFEKNADGLWFTVADEEPWTVDEISVPATVLWTPDDHEPLVIEVPTAADCSICEDEMFDVGRGSSGFAMFRVCGRCGNRRCPKATWHGNPCTSSNEPGQAGSRYGTAPHKLDELPG
jgi:hypothetical protein